MKTAALFARIWTAFAALVVSFAYAGTAISQNAIDNNAAFHPSKAVTIIVPYTAGGGADASCRLLAKALGELWKQTVVVDNRPGANGSIGAAIVARAPADGYTLLWAVSSLAINPHLMPTLPFDTLTAFAPITPAANPISVLIGSPTLPATDLRSFIEVVKKEGPEKRTFASSEPMSRLISEQIFQKAGVKLTHIPYKGASQFMGDIVGGRVDVGVSSFGSAKAMIESGNVKVLGVVGDRRIDTLPAVATLKEQGISDVGDPWFGLFAPGGTPASVIKAIYADVSKALATPELRSKFADLGMVPGEQTPDEFAQRFRREYVEFGKLIRKLNMQPKE